jgi:hypothetical protein
VNVTRSKSPMSCACTSVSSATPPCPDAGEAEIARAEPPAPSRGERRPGSHGVRQFDAWAPSTGRGCIGQPAHRATTSRAGPIEDAPCMRRPDGVRPRVAVHAATDGARRWARTTSLGTTRRLGDVVIGADVRERHRHAREKP